MKLSISVPDELWAQAAPADSSPSEVVQQALSEMVFRRNPKSPWGRAPEPGVVKESKESLGPGRPSPPFGTQPGAPGRLPGGAVVATDPSLDLDWFGRRWQPKTPSRSVISVNRSRRNPTLESE